MPTRQTLNTGDIWSDVLATASGNPTHFGSGVFGDGAKIIDDWLDDAPDQLKAYFYGWRNRIKVSVGTGLAVSYSGASILLADGSQVVLVAGSLTLPASSTVFVYVNSLGTLTYSTSLPSSCIPLAKVVTGAATITSISDLRYQSCEQVRPLSVADASGYDIGDIKTTARLNPSVGYVRCDGAIYNDISYPLAAGVIGRQFSLPSDAAGTFRVPDLRDRVSIGSSPTRPTGTLLGEESVRLSVANLAKHGHAIVESPHTHTATDSGHAHGVNDSGHGHPILGAYSPSGGSTDSIIVEAAGIAGEQNGPFGYVWRHNNGTGDLLVLPQSSGVSIQSGRSNVTLNPISTGSSVATTGESVPISVIQPSCSLAKHIRLY
jgi:microcystin-dependent protein